MHPFDYKSIFHPYYLLSGLIIALVWLLLSGHNFAQSFRLIFSKKTWITSSTFTDLKITAIYFILLRTLVIGFEAIIFGSIFSLLQRLPYTLNFILPSWSEAILATITTMLSIDLASYLIHRLMHKIPWIWEIHSIHHSANNLTPLTTYRQHPLEPFILYGGRGLFAGIGLGLFYKLFPSQTPVITIYGMGVGFFIYMFTVNLHHFPVPVRYPKALRKILISPHVHHLHHSANREHFNKNFGVVFSFWDQLAGTYLDKKIGPDELQFGLGKDQTHHQSITKSFLAPFVKIFKN